MASDKLSVGRVLRPGKTCRVDADTFGYPEVRRCALFLIIR